MGCGGSSPAEAPQPRPQGKPGQFGWGQPGHQIRVEPPNPNDPAFMQTVAPSGTTWGQYVRTGSSFVDPRTGFLAGPWAECIAWAVVFEHSNDWGSMPQYAADGVVGGVLQALEAASQGKPNKDQIMAAADRLEQASHALAENGEPLPSINQVVMLPDGAVPGQPCRVENPQMPGTYMTVQVPPNQQPGQPMMTPMKVQPNQSGGMSTGGKVALAAGGAVAVGALAAGAYYGLGPGGGMEGMMGDLDTAGVVLGDAAGDAGAWAEGAAGDAGDWMGGAGEDIGEFAGEAFDGAGDFGGEAMDFIDGLF